MDLYLKITALVVLLLLSGFFSSSETALFSLSKVKLRRRTVRKNKSFKYILSLLKSPSTFLSTVLIGNEIVNISISVVTAGLIFSLAKERFSSGVLPFLSVAVTVPVLLIFGEIIPKTFAVKFPETIARYNARFLYLFSKAVTPIRFVLTLGAKAFIRLFVKDPTKQPMDSISMDEDIFKSMVDIGSREGTIEAGERELIHRTFRLDDIPISRIMTPRDRIVAVPLNATEEAFMQIVEEQKYSRYPVFKGSIDRIVGFIHAKDLLRTGGVRKLKKTTGLKALVRKPSFVLEGRNALSVFLQFQRAKSHIAVVQDKAGTSVGIITMEDILEELFGEIMDETDREQEGDA